MLLAKAIKKYGKKNFKRVTLSDFETEEEALEYEHNLIMSLNAVRSRKYYNRYNGDYSCNLSGENNPMYGKHHSDESKKKMSDANKGKYNGINNPNYGNGDKIRGDKNPAKRPEVRKKLSDNRKGEKAYWYGKKFPETVIKKMKDGRRKGENCISSKLTEKEVTEIKRN